MMRTMILILCGCLVGKVLMAQEATPAPTPLPFVAQPETLTFPELDALEPAVKRQLNRLQLELKNAASREDNEDTFSVLLVLGQAYHAYDFLDEAAICYRNALRVKADGLEPAYLLAEIYRRKGEVDKAIILFAKVLKGFPNYAPAMVQWGDILIQRNQWDQAELLFQRALELEPQSAAVNTGLAKIASGLGQYKKATELLKRALEELPDANLLHYQLSVAYRKLGEHELAKKHLALRGKVNPIMRDPILDRVKEMVIGERLYLIRGKTALGAKRYQDAIASFKQALDANPKSLVALVNLGSTAALAGDGTLAIKAFEKALTIDPKHANANFNLGHLLILKGDPGRAMGYLEQAVESGPDDIQATMLLADLKKRKGDREGALQLYEEALSWKRDLVEARVQRASLLLEMNRFEEAYEFLAKDVGYFPQSGRLNQLFARLLAGSPIPTHRDGERALTLARKLVAAQNSVANYETMAMALAELGRCDEAAKVLDSALNHLNDKPDDPRIPRFRKDLERYQKGAPCGEPLGS